MSIKILDDFIDAYNLRARLFPALLMLLPVGLAVSAWFPVDLAAWGSLAGAGVAIGGATMLKQFARDQGKSKEAVLYAAWGGKPSVRMLSFRHSQLNRDTLARCHAKLRELDPTLKLPATITEEAADSVTALFAFESASDLLVEKTRDKQKFGLLFEENMNYGFRRNLWGLKPYGIALAACGLAACVVKSVLAYRTTEELPPVPAALAIGCVLSLVLWWRLIRPDWVRRAGDSYAHRLILSCQQL